MMICFTWSLPFQSSKRGLPSERLGKGHIIIVIIVPLVLIVIIAIVVILVMVMMIVMILVIVHRACMETQSRSSNPKLLQSTQPRLVFECRPSGQNIYIHIHIYIYMYIYIYTHTYV